jgi:hypothetical protein
VLVLEAKLQQEAAIKAIPKANFDFKLEIPMRWVKTLGEMPQLFWPPSPESLAEKCPGHPGCP